MNADQHAEVRRSAQLASLAEHAANPAILELEENLVQRIAGLAKTSSAVQSEQLWSLAGGISALRELRHRLSRAKEKV